jgi:hypothetical protein
MAEPLRQPEGRAVGLSRGRWCSSPHRLAHMPNSGHSSLHNYALIRIFRQPEMISSSMPFPQPRHAERRLDIADWRGRRAIPVRILCVSVRCRIDTRVWLACGSSAGIKSQVPTLRDVSSSGFLPGSLSSSAERTCTGFQPGRQGAAFVRWMVTTGRSSAALERHRPAVAERWPGQRDHGPQQIVLEPGHRRASCRRSTQAPASADGLPPER